MKYSRQCEMKAELAGCVVKTRKIKQFKGWAKAKPVSEERDQEVTYLEYLRQRARGEARCFHLALGRLRGRDYACMEPKTHLNRSERRDLALKVSRLIYETPANIEAWMGLMKQEEAAA